VVFEYIVSRVNRSTVYVLTAMVSFIFSAHVLPERNEILLAVIFVDIGILATIFILFLSIKCCTRTHNLMLACKPVFEKIVQVGLVVYCVFITAVALANTIPL
jgi:cell division protein FtsW (lipid II flippase)